MHPASRRQITRMLETFSRAPEVTAFDLGCLNHETGRMSFRKTWTAPEVRKAFGWLAARNATGSSCYIRPAAALGRTSWVLAGPLSGTALEGVAAVDPGLVVESSPGLFEAWLRLAAPVDLDTRLAVARFFTREAGGDAGTVRPAQLGHLPGTTNRTPSRAGDGLVPFAVLRSSSPAAVTPMPREVERSAGARVGGGGEPTSAGEDHPAGRRDGPGPDQSRRDFAIACRLLEAGAGDHTIAATIAAARDFDPQCAGAYLPRTIRAARLHIQSKGHAENRLVGDR